MDLAAFLAKLMIWDVFRQELQEQGSVLPFIFVKTILNINLLRRISSDLAIGQLMQRRSYLTKSETPYRKFQLVRRSNKLEEAPGTRKYNVSL